MCWWHILPFVEIKDHLKLHSSPRRRVQVVAECVAIGGKKEIHLVDGEENKVDYKLFVSYKQGGCCLSDVHAYDTHALSHTHAHTGAGGG